MEKVNYATIAKKLLGDEMYCNFIKEISKENEGKNLVDFGKEVVERACLLIVMLGMSRKIQMDTVKICVGDKIIEVSCKEFATKYEKYLKEMDEKPIKIV